jgi:acyl-CoA thioesterase-1
LDRNPILPATLLLTSLVACSEAVGSETETRALQVEAPSAQAAESTLPTIIMPAEDGQPKVAFLGDSLAGGQYLAEQQGFPFVVQRRLRAGGANFTLINASVNGDTTEAALRRVDWLLKQEPNVVVIELGQNDKDQGLPAAAVERNLRAIIAKVRAAQAQPLLLGLSFVPDAHSERARALAYARELEAVYPRIATELNVPFVPHFMRGVMGRRELTLPDGVHPTPEGHERLASNILEPLRRLLAE